MAISIELNNPVVQQAREELRIAWMMFGPDRADWQRGSRALRDLMAELEGREIDYSKEWPYEW